MNNLRFLETIRAEDGTPFHLEYHQRRLENTLHAFGIWSSHDLDSLLLPPENGLYRCRVLYDKNHIDISYHPYQLRTFTSLQAVIADTIDYGYKYSDRKEIDALFAMRKASDDIVIVKHGLITDTTIANIALFDGQNWVTPTEPLLHGTTRQRLIDEGKLLEKTIPLDSLSLYSNVAMMNALVGFIEVENGIILPNKEGV